MSAEGFSHLACPNPECPRYGQRGTGNLRLHGWSGRGKRIRCLRCATCGTDFSERATPPVRPAHQRDGLAIGTGTAAIQAPETMRVLDQLENSATVGGDVAE